MVLGARKRQRTWLLSLPRQEDNYIAAYVQVGTNGALISVVAFDVIKGVGRLETTLQVLYYTPLNGTSIMLGCTFCRSALVHVVVLFCVYFTVAMQLV